MSSLTQQTSISWRRRSLYARRKNAHGFLLRHVRAVGAFFASFLAAMHESRRCRAEQEIQQHQYLIHQAQAYHDRCEIERQQRLAPTRIVQ
jgi:hypothetical protein